MDALPAAKPLGLLSILIFASGLLFLIRHWPQGRHATFSNHAAAQRATIWYYIGLFGVSLPLLFIFFWQWFVPAFHLTHWFLVLALASALLQHTVTIIPEVGGWKTKWHRVLTASSALLLLPMLGILLAADTVNSLTKSITTASLAGMIAVVIYQVFIANKLAPQNQLLWQIVYYGLFFTAIMTAAYTI